MDFSEINTLTQTALTELVLASIWSNSQYAKLATTTKNLIIGLDEFQNISLKIRTESSKEWIKKLLNLKVGESTTIENLRMGTLYIDRPILLNQTHGDTSS